MTIIITPAGKFQKITMIPSIMKIHPIIEAMLPKKILAISPSMASSCKRFVRSIDIYLYNVN